MKLNKKGGLMENQFIIEAIKVSAGVLIVALIGIIAVWKM
jgi:hypothetical protein